MQQRTVGDEVERSLRAELEQAKRDVEAKEDLLLLTKKDNERLRSLLRDSREEFRAQVEQVAGAKATAETQLMDARIQLERERGSRRDVQRELEEAVNEREKQVRQLSDFRKQVNNKLATLMEELKTREKELDAVRQTLEQRDRERERLLPFEKLFHAREEQLGTVLAELTSLQVEYTKVTAREQAMQQELEAFRLLHERDLLQPKATQQQVPPAAIPQPNRPQTPQSQPQPQPTHRSHSNRPAPIVIDTTGNTLPSHLNFVREVTKEVSQDFDLCEALFDELTDLRTVLTRGTSASSDLVGGQSQDRKRLASMRRMQATLAAQVKHADEQDELRSLAQSAREGMVKLFTTLTAVIEFAKEVRQFVERHCTAFGGLEALAHGAPARSATPTRPQPWPMQSADGDAPRVDTPPNSPPPVPVPRGAPPDRLLVQLQEGLQTKDRELMATKLALGEAQHHANLGDATAKRYEAQVQRLQQDVDALRARELESDQRLREAQAQLMDAQNRMREEREGHLSAQASQLRRHDEELSQLRRERDQELRAAEQRYDTDLRTFATRFEEAQRERSEVTQRETRLTHELEKAKERIAALKSQRNGLEDEAKALRQKLAETAKAAKHYQSSVDMLAAEVDHYKSVEEFDAQQREHLLTHEFDDDLWSEWKATKRKQLASEPPQAALSRAKSSSSSGAPRVGSVGPTSSNVTPIRFVKPASRSTSSINKR